MISMINKVLTDEADPYLEPSNSLDNRLGRLLWNCVYHIMFRPSPRWFFAWRVMLLRAWGAKIGKNCHIYPKAQIWAPWNLVCGDVVAIADDAIIYNPKLISLGSYSIISQQAYLCGATHDYNSMSFPLISAPIEIGDYSWICARATVQMGVKVEDGAVLGLGGIATKNLDAWCVYAGVPARKVKERERHDEKVLLD